MTTSKIRGAVSADCGEPVVAKLDSPVLRTSEGSGVVW